jgi:hypothetical protein
VLLEGAEDIAADGYIEGEAFEGAALSIIICESPYEYEEPIIGSLTEMTALTTLRSSTEGIA